MACRDSNGSKRSGSGNLPQSGTTKTTTKTTRTRKRGRRQRQSPTPTTTTTTTTTNNSITGWVSLLRRTTVLLMTSITTLLFFSHSSRRGRTASIFAAAFRPSPDIQRRQPQHSHSRSRLQSRSHSRSQQRGIVYNRGGGRFRSPYHSTMDPSDRIEEAHATTIRTTTPQTSIGFRFGRCSTSSAVTLRSATTAETDTTTLSNDDSDENENDGDNVDADVDVDNYYDANWKDSPLVNPRITFDTLLVPSSQLTKWITHPELQHRLAKPDNWEFLKHVHPRIKMVQDYVDEDEDNSDRDSNRSTKDKKGGGGGGGLFKQLLLLPSSVLHENANQTATGMAPSDSQDEHETERWLENLLLAAASSASLSSSSSLLPDENTKPNDGGSGSSDDDDARPVTATATIQKGPALTMPIAYHQLSFQYLLRRLLPESAYPVPSAYEQIGHVAHFNLRERHLPYRKLIGEVLLASSSTTTTASSSSSGGSNKNQNNNNNNNSIKTVVNKVGKVDGKFRTYECQILADVYNNDGSGSGRSSGGGDGGGGSNGASSSLETTVTEDGVTIELNVAECYWSTRLSGERQELIQDILRSKPNKNEPLVVADVFCGAGAVCMILAKKIKDRHKDGSKSKSKKNKKNNDNNNNNDNNDNKKHQSAAPSTPSLSKQQQQQRPLLTVLANDWNPKAIEYMARSITANGMDKEKDGQSMYHRFDLSCRDSYDFLFELGEEQPSVSKAKVNPYVKKRRTLRRKTMTTTNDPAAAADPAPKDVESESESEEEQQEPQQQKQQQQQQQTLPDHVLMNFPLEAPRFLGALRWWSWKRLEQEHLEKSTSRRPWYPRFHVYTFAWSSEPRVGDEEEMAINLVANELIPPYVFSDTARDASDDNGDGDADAEDATAPAIYRRAELDDEFGTDISTRMVRDVAPGKVVVCVSFSVTPKLIRYMQGDYS